MAEFNDIVRSIRLKGNDGTHFERFCKWFLQNEPYWKTQVDKIWLWDEWPKKCGRDKGIDLVFRHKNRVYWAFKTKCYNESYSIKKGDIGSFLS
tara:strand:+ start:404 stop:685 length:282 start_codon:yes stop_codon:yes gene_type:complete